MNMNDKVEKVKKWGRPGRTEIMDAIDICEGLVESTQSEEREAWQYLINTGVCWELQGWFGRTAARLIEDGVCHEASER